MASVPGAEALAALRLHRQPLPGVFSKRWSPSVLRRPPMPVCRAKPGTDTTSALAHGTGAHVGHYLELAPSPSAHLRGGFSGSSSEAIGKGIPAHCHGPRAGSGTWQCHFSTAWRVTDSPGRMQPPSFLLLRPSSKRLVQNGGDVLARVRTEPLEQRERSALEGISVSSDHLLNRDRKKTSHSEKAMSAL